MYVLLYKSFGFDDFSKKGLASASCLYKNTTADGQQLRTIMNNAYKKVFGKKVNYIDKEWWHFDPRDTKNRRNFNNYY